MKSIWKFLRSLDWRVLFAVPVLSLLLGVANNLRVPKEQQVRWSGERPTIAIEEEVETDANRGVWTTDFVAATNAAESAHLPVVVFVLLPECPFCIRFHEQVLCDEVKEWQRKLGWYFVMTTSDKAPDALNFVKNTPIRNRKPPYVGVYWTRPDGTRVMRNFTVKTDSMGVPPEPSLVREWMHAIEASVPGAPGASFALAQGVGVQVDAKSENVTMGRVTMSPQVDAILPGEQVVLTAIPRRSVEFAGWRYPDGRLVRGGPQLTLDDQCQAGVYKAVFRSRKGSGRGVKLRRIKEDE